MTIQHCETHLLDGASRFGRSARVIDHPVVCVFTRDPRFTDKNHDVKRKLLDPRLTEEKKISRFGLFSIATNEFGVEHLQSLRVGELGKFACIEICGSVSAGSSAKKFSMKWRGDI